MKASKLSPITAAAWIVLAAVSIFKLIYALSLELHPDEAYYWEWSRHLDWGYYDQGPGTAYYIRFFTLIFGDTLFALKFAAAFAGFLGHGALYLTARRLISEGASFAFLVCTLLIPGFFGGSLLIMHDSVLVIFFALALLFSVRWIQTRSTLDLALLFAFIALGFLGKHTMVFFALGLVLWMIVSPEYWAELRKPALYACAALAAVLSMPVVIWNLQHNWDGIGAIVNLRSSGGAHADKATTGAYLAGQSFLFSPIWLFAFVAMGLVALVRKVKSAAAARKAGTSVLAALRFPDQPAHRLVWIVAWILPLFFLFMSARKEVQPNWPFASYGPMMLALFLSGAHLSRSGRSMLAGGAVAAIVINTLFLLPAVLMMLVKQVRPSDQAAIARAVPQMRLAGYKDVVMAVEEQRKKTDPTAQLMTNRYQDAAIAAFHLPGQPHVGSLNILQRNQYNYWPSVEKNRNYFVFIVQENTCEKAMFFFQPVLAYMFEEVTAFPEQEILKDGVPVKRYQTWYVKNFRRDWKQYFQYYMLGAAIFEFMPNLRGYGTDVTSADSMGKLSDFMTDSYFSRRGNVKCEF